MAQVVDTNAHQISLPKTSGGTTTNKIVNRVQSTYSSPKVAQPTYTPSTSYSSGGSSSSSEDTTSSYNAILDAYKSQLASARDSYINAIQKKLDAGKQTYQSQMDEAKEYYEGNRNQSEVQRYKAKKSLREALANRGQLDSGYGRQETLDMNMNYDNALNTINNQEASTLTQIKNYIAQLEAEAESEKAQANQNYANSLISLANL